ncbi:MAG: hypothetical protein ACLGHN_04730 [Bacteriovoracia bacterium]
MIQTTLPDGRVIGYEYNPDGKIIGITPPGRPKHSFSFNLMDLVQTYEPPLLTGMMASHTTYSYNDDKQMTAIHRPDGQVVNFNYNLVTGLLESRDNQTYTYYPNTDLVQSILSPDGVSSNFTYFGTQRVLSESQSFNGETALSLVLALQQL